MDVYVTINKKLKDDFRNWQEKFPRTIDLVVEDVWNEDQSLGIIGSLIHTIRKMSNEDDLIVLTGDNYLSSL